MEPHEERAEHVGPEFDLARQASRETILATPALHYLAHYSSGVFDFGVDVLGDPGPAPDALPGGTRREELKRLGRHLTFQVATLDRALQEVRTGRLIRTVLHTDEGALFCDSVVPTEHVVGLVLDHAGAGPLFKHPAVDEADRALAGLATRLRRQLSLGSLNPGGWDSAEDVVALPADGAARPHVTTAEDPQVTAAEDPQVTAAEDPHGSAADEPHATAADEPLTACLAAVRAQDLQLVAHVVGGEVRAMVDVLGDPSLAPFFKQITIDARRRFYHGFVRELGALATKLNRAVNPVMGGLVSRLVLDVEMGAVYYYRLRAGEYLAGVTIDQSRVGAADDRMSALAAEITPIGP